MTYHFKKFQTIYGYSNRSIEEVDPGLVYSNLSTLETVFGYIFQSITYINQNLTESNLIKATASLKGNVTELTEFILQNYKEFRSVIFNLKVDIADLEVTITESSIFSSSTTDSSTSKSSDLPILSDIIFPSMIFIAIFTGKLHKRKKKV